MVRGKTREKPATELADEINKLTNDISHDKFELVFCPYRCGKIARFIIAAWAHQVQIIVWDKKGKTTTRRARKRKVVRKRRERRSKKDKADKKEIWPEYGEIDKDYSVMPSVDNFPDTSALGGA